jgi:hypothetical protein
LRSCANRNVAEKKNVDQQPTQPTNNHSAAISLNLPATPEILPGITKG